MRCIDTMCEAIMLGKFHPDRPAGTEWDTSEIVFEPVWDGQRQPQTVSPVPGDDGDTSLDEACTTDIHDTEDDSAAADWLDSIKPTTMSNNSRVKGYIFTRTQLKKVKTPSFHIAVRYEDVPVNLVGCKNKDRRASITIMKQQWHALCDTKLNNVEYARTKRQALTLGYT